MTSPIIETIYNPRTPRVSVGLLDTTPAYH